VTATGECSGTAGLVVQALARNIRNAVLTIVIVWLSCFPESLTFCA
jgi:hypothetical protein